MENDFGVGVESQVMIPVSQQSFLENAVIRELAIETKAEPLSFVDVLSLEGLGVVSVILPAGRIADVPNRGPAGQVLHQGLRLGSVIQTEDLRDRTDILAIPQQRWTIGIKGGHAGGKLPSILNIEQHSRQKSRDVPRPIVGTDRTAATTREMVDGCNTTLVM
jgi:hypothetical protein